MRSSTAPIDDQAFDRRSFLRRAGGIGLLVSPGLSVLLGACGGDRPEAGGDRRVAYQLKWLKNIQFAGSFMALENGYYRNNGFNVDLQAGGPSVDTATVVSSGRSMLGLGASNVLAVARGKGIPIKAFGAIFQKSPLALISLAKSPLRTLEDQYDKTVAVADTTRPTIEALMKRKGLDPTKVQFVPKNPDPSVVADGQVQGYWGFASTEAAVLQERGVEVESILLTDLGEPAQDNVLFTTEAVLQARRGEIVSLLRAEVAGWQWYLDNPDQTAQLVFDKYGETHTPLAIVKRQAMAQIDLVKTGDAADKGLLWVSRETLESNIRSAVDSGVIKKSYPVEDLMTTELIAEVHR